jgi:hypothetical protein
MNTEWDGSDLPPAGIWCEILSMPEPKGAWCKGKILYISKSSCVWCWREGQIDMCANSFEMEFRPIRTPEQIAEEEKSEAISDLLKIWKIAPSRESNYHYDLAERAYDAGYRKQ